jgi:L-alanine-DL-glutamate epimerase-like enolase superfamily enzyme
MKITRVETDHLRVPLHRPVPLPAAQDPRFAKELDVLFVRVHTDGGHTGLGLTYSFGGGTAIASLLADHVAPIVVGDDPTKTEWLFARAAAELEAVGFAGLAARAYAAVDLALWDLKGKLAGLPVAKLLGGYRTKLKAIVADTATPALGVKQAVKETRAALDAGAAGVLVEVGTQDPDIDGDRVRQMREAVPEGAWFEATACGRYDFSTALWMGRMFEEEFGLDGFADPLHPADRDGLKRLIDRLEMGVSVGALFDRTDDFVRVLDLGGVSSLRVDPLRLGGLTPARKVALAAELRHVAVCPVRVPQVGCHLAGGIVWGRVCEYVDWLADLCPHGPRFADGQLVIPDAPGLGLEPDEKKAAKWRV